MTSKIRLLRRILLVEVLGQRSRISSLPRFNRGLREITGSFLLTSEGSPITPKVVLSNVITTTAVKRGSSIILTNRYDCYPR